MIQSQINSILDECKSKITRVLRDQTQFEHSKYYELRNKIDNLQLQNQQLQLQIRSNPFLDSPISRPVSRFLDSPISRPISRFVEEKEYEGKRKSRKRVRRSKKSCKK